MPNSMEAGLKHGIFGNVLDNVSVQNRESAGFLRTILGGKVDVRFPLVSYVNRHDVERQKLLTNRNSTFLDFPLF